MNPGDRRALYYLMRLLRPARVLEYVPPAAVAGRRVASEIPLAVPRPDPGGFIPLHDFFPGLQPLGPDGKVIDGPQSVRELQRAGWPLDVLPLGDLPWRTKLGTSRTSLALLGRAS